MIYLSQYFGKEDYAKNPKFYPLGDILLEGMRELLAKEQSDVRMFIKTVEALNGLARARPEESAKFYKEAESILKKAVKYKGTTFRDFRDGEGKRGGFSKFLKVYQREGRTCLKCRKEKIKKISVGGRGTRYCPVCQK